MLYSFLEALKDKQKWQSRSLTPDIFNFDILFAILQLITRDDSKARELTQNCASTISFQSIIDYLSVLLHLESGDNADV